MLFHLTCLEGLAALEVQVELASPPLNSLAHSQRLVEQGVFWDFASETINYVRQTQGHLKLLGIVLL